MKKIFYTILLTLGLLSCQVIPENERLIPIEVTSSNRTVLLMEFTGFLCVNCPNAAEEAHKLLELYPDNLVVVAMHPEGNDFTKTAVEKYNYTCPEAQVYYQFVGGTSTTPFPTGVLDMSSNGSSYFRDYSQWAFILSTLLERPAEVSIEAMVTQEKYQIKVSSSEQRDVHVLLWIVEDNILGAQRMPDGSNNMEYVHNHMLRGEVLSEDAWGVSKTLGTTPTVLEASYAWPTAHQEINRANCSAVVVVLDANSKHPLNVKQVKIQ